MKKTIFSLALLLTAIFCYPKTQLALSQIYLQVRIEDPTIYSDPIRRAPVAIPSVSIEGHTIVFNTPCDNNVLRFINEDGEVEYTVVIASSTTSMTLPSYLSGVYELQLIRGQFCFYGNVEF